MYQIDKYYLMHKNTKVASFSMTDYGTSIKIIDILEPSLMPYGTHVAERSLNERFTEWKNDRRIPVDRPYTMQIYKKTKKSIPELETLNKGLSFTDCYWFQPIEENNKWEDVNFFNNGFNEEIGKMLINANNDTPTSLKSPDLTLAGECPKMWCHFNNTINLVKGCRIYAETKVEICNEVFASLLAEKLGIDTVQYYLMKSGDQIDFCCAENFIKSDAEEFVTFKQIASDTSTYGINGILQFIKEHNMQDYLNKLLVLDFLIGNYNRCIGDVGIIINSNTMQFLRPAPLFDFEESFDWNLFEDDIPGIFAPTIQQQIKLVSDFTWIDFDVMEDVLPEIDRIYSIGGFRSSEIKNIKTYFKNRINLLKKEIPVEQLKHKQKVEYKAKEKKTTEGNEQDIVRIRSYNKVNLKEEKVSNDDADNE